MNKAEKILLTVVGLISAPFIASWVHEQWIFSGPERVYASFREVVSENGPSSVLCSKQRYLYYIARDLHKNAISLTDINKLINLPQGRVLDPDGKASLRKNNNTKKSALNKSDVSGVHSIYYYQTAKFTKFDYGEALYLDLFFDKQDKLIATVVSGTDPETGKLIERQIVWRSDNV
jgi:hypothetical protein